MDILDVRYWPEAPVGERQLRGSEIQKCQGCQSSLPFPRPEAEKDCSNRAVAKHERPSTRWPVCVHDGTVRYRISMHQASGAYPCGYGSPCRGGTVMLFYQAYRHCGKDHGCENE